MNFWYKTIRTKAYAEIVDDSGDVAVRFGLVRPTLLPLFDIDGIDVYGFEMENAFARWMKFFPLPEYPGTRRELNFILPEETPVAVVTRLV